MYQNFLDQFTDFVFVEHAHRCLGHYFLSPETGTLRWRNGPPLSGGKGWPL